MRASIVIPVYNQRDFLAQAIQSAVSQTYRDFEVIVVNDGSTDDSLSVAQQFSSVRIVDQENKGLSEARNAGIAAATGDLILPLDSDDYIHPNYLDRTVPFMGDPQVGVVSTDMQYFGLASNRIPPKGTTLEWQKWSNDLPVCSLIRRKALDDAKGYETVSAKNSGGATVYGFEDWELWIDILKHGWKVAVVNEPLFHYRIRESSMIARANTGRAALIQEIQKRHPDLYGRV